MPSYSNCDEGAYPAESTKAISLTPNQFHKLCPGTHTTQVQQGGDGSTTLADVAFGQPGCGDGSSFSFLFSRPLKQFANDQKIIIEFQGGGACWDEDTCEMQQAYLSFPDYFDAFVGMSCSEIEYGAAVQNGNPLSLLCAKSIGDTNFREYNTVVIPYCTQDVHIGDARNVSYNGGNNSVNHVGAHNMIRTLNWIFANFPNPTHIFITGCSAGGTAVPIAYDLVNKHYNSFVAGGPRSVNINAIMDSSVYLTPSYFLQNGFPNWQPDTIMNKLGFDYEKHKFDENYPDLLWNHVLRRGSNFDHWGFVTHSNDPISLAYYRYMSGSNNERRSLFMTSHVDTPASTSSKLQGRRMYDDFQSQWWTEIQNSILYIKSKHHNVDTYIIDSEGHCSFGLYYPLQEESFEAWAAPIVKERLVIGNRRPSVAAFIASVALGGCLVLFVRRSKRKDAQVQSSFDESNNLQSSFMDKSDSIATKRMRLGFLLGKIERVLHPVVATKFQSCPWTAGYLLSTTIYFISMLCSQGFTHPLNNLALGPSAASLSTFGINNPSLIIYRMEHFRLLTSSFLCSGIIPYLLMTYTLYKTGLETAMTHNKHPYWHFVLVASMISFAINLGYACVGNGASCSGLELALGLNMFSILMRRRSSMFNAPVRFTLAAFIVGCTPILPFESWISFLVAVFVGMILGLTLFVDTHEATVTIEVVQSFTIRWKCVHALGLIQILVYILITLRIPSPDQRYLYPYQTGCGLVYSDQVGDFINSYTNGDRRVLNTDEMCAQTCVPHLAYRLSLWGAKQFSPFSIDKGTCQDHGYNDHIADKTFYEYSVVFEVQLFGNSETNENSRLL